MMKFKVICTEMFQTVESIIECETYQELADHLRCVKNAIKDAYSDVKPKKSSKPTKKTEEQASNEVLYEHKGMATQKQIDLIKKKVDKTKIEQIDFSKMTSQEASDFINELFS